MLSTPSWFRRRARPRVDSLSLKEIVEVTVIRALPGGGYGQPEQREVQDLVVDAGCIYLAKRVAGGDAVASAMLYTAVGTVSTAPTNADTLLTGEVKRRLSTISSATLNNLYTNAATFGGASDSISSVVLREAGVFNHALSGQATMFQRVTFAAVTLADSDLFRITMETLVGSRTATP